MHGQGADCTDNLEPGALIKVTAVCLRGAEEEEEEEKEEEEGGGKKGRKSWVVHAASGSLNN